MLEWQEIDNNDLTFQEIGMTRKVFCGVGVNYFLTKEKTKVDGLDKMKIFR